MGLTTPVGHARHACFRLALSAAAAAILPSAMAADAKISYSGSVPAIVVDGKVLPPCVLTQVKYRPQEACEKQVRDMSAIGIDILCLHNFFMTSFWGKNGWNFGPIDSAITRYLEVNPNAMFMFYFRGGVTLWKEWMDAHPDELVRFAKYDPRTKYGEYSGNPLVPSFASEVYRAEERRFLAELGAFCRSKPWAGRIVAFRNGYGGSGDGMPCGCHSMPDTGPRMTERFRAWLAAKYATDEALREAWGDASVTRAAACVPDAGQRYGSGLFLRDLSDPRDRRVADYYACYHEVLRDYMLHFCKTVKREFPGALAGVHYGYCLLDYSPEGQTSDCERLLAAPEVDFMVSGEVGYHLTDALPRHVTDMFHRYGKLSLFEGDVRTHHGLGQTESKWTCRTSGETAACVTKVFGNALFGGCGFNVTDFGKRGMVKWFDCPEAMKPLEAGIREWRRMYADPPENAADVAVVIDPDQIWRQGHPTNYETRWLRSNFMQYAMMAMSFSGFAYDTLTPDGYLTSKCRYKAVYFPNFHDGDPARAALVRERLRRDSATAIWGYAPGLLAPGLKGYSEDAMRNLTGMGLAVRREPAAFSAAFAEGCAPGGVLKTHETRKGWKDAPRIFVDDPEASAIAKFEDDGSVAFARKALSDGTVAVFAGAPIVRADVWASVLREAGCHAFTRPGFHVKRNSRYLQVFSGRGGNIAPECFVQKGQIDQSGSVEIALERPAKTVRDVITGLILAEDAKSLKLSAPGPHVWLMEIVER